MDEPSTKGRPITSVVRINSGRVTWITAKAHSGRLYKSETRRILRTRLQTIDIKFRERDILKCPVHARALWGTLDWVGE